MSGFLLKAFVQQADELFELGHGRVDVLLLALERGDPFDAAVARREHLRVLVIADVVKVEQLTDIVEAETHTLPAQDPGEAGPIPVRIEPRGAAALGRNQLLVLVEAQRTGGHAEGLAHLSDRIEMPLRVHSGPMLYVYGNVN